jgi:hypothetical protein
MVTFNSQSYNLTHGRLLREHNALNTFAVWKLRYNLLTRRLHQHS